MGVVTALDECNEMLKVRKEMRATSKTFVRPSVQYIGFFRD